MLQLKRYARSFATVLVLMVLGLGTGFYILTQQRLPNPFKTFYKVDAAFPTAAGVVAGLGEPVTVAGVHVGEILSTQLKNGQGVIEMDIDPSKGVPHLYRNAYAVLTPTTPLDDMYVDINPGSKSAGVLPAGGTIPISNSTSPTDNDELLDELDSDTRDWVASLITELANGTRGRGTDIRDLLGTLGPTARQMRTIGDLLASRRTELSQLVHNLSVLTGATSQDDAQLGQVVRSGNTTVQALAGQDVALQRALAELPGTLATTRTTFSDLTSFSHQLGPTATALTPIARNLPKTLSDTKTLVQGAALLPLNQVRSFERVATPLASQLTTLDHGLTTVLPNVTTSFKALSYITNELAYDPGSGNPGFLYWLGWFFNNIDSFVGNTDANGPAWRSVIMTTCSSINSFSYGPLLEAVLGTNFGCSS